MKPCWLLPLPWVLSIGCLLGPDYERPYGDAPEEFRRSAGAASTDRSFGDLAWTELFTDPVLQKLVHTALRDNFDVRIAAERIVEFRSRVTIARADLFPDIVGGPSYRWSRVSENDKVPLPPGVDPEQGQVALTGDLAWEIDFWGRVRRATEAARAELLASEYAAHAVAQTLVAEIARAYFELLEFDEELVIARRTLASRERSLQIVTYRLEEGVSNRVELRQAESLVIQAAGLIPELEKLIEQQENFIQILRGQNPGPVPRGLPLGQQQLDAAVPPGLPSELLERRPDVRAAEEFLVASNARIGEAKALLFPSIRLTSTYGRASEHLDDLFRHSSRVWDVVPSATLPIFNAGRLRSGVAVTESQQRQAVLEYQLTLKQAFREVADALIAGQKTREVREWRQQLEETLRDQADLSSERYRGGVTSYLEVLDSERDYFDAELELARSRREELVAVVALYRALGGGWGVDA